MRPHIPRDRAATALEHARADARAGRRWQDPRFGCDCAACRRARAAGWRPPLLVIFCAHLAPTLTPGEPPC